tara:strand:+ start:288 stop:977 length:690 start_codon:yes stop_codon:yes gene_type:complete
MELHVLNYKLHKQEIRKNYYNGNIEFNKPQNILINSLIKSGLLNNAIAEDNYKNVYFKCSSMCLLQDIFEKLKPINIYKMIYDISSQMRYLLEDQNSVFIGFDPRHILIVNEDTYLYINGEHLEKIDNQENIEIKYPPNSQDYILAPELFEISDLPCKINYKCSYYSIGILYLYMFKTIETKNMQKIDANDEEEITQLLKNLSINHTKIYYFLQRCLQKNPVNRQILFV